MKRKGGTNNRELADLKYQVNDQKSKLAELASENADLKTTNSKLQEMLKGEQQVISYQFFLISWDTIFFANQACKSWVSFQDRAVLNSEHLQHLAF